MLYNTSSCASRHQIRRWRTRLKGIQVTSVMLLQDIGMFHGGRKAFAASCFGSSGHSAPRLEAQQPGHRKDNIDIDDDNDRSLSEPQS